MRLDHTRLKLHTVCAESPARFEAGTVEVVEAGAVPHDLPFGKISAVAGEAAYCFIERACKLAMRGEVQAICTAPISKEALGLDGQWPGICTRAMTIEGRPRAQNRLMP